MVTVQLNPQQGGTLHEQIAAGIRRAVGAGEIAPGERLPTARVLAGDLTVNTNTVLRAYRELAGEGLLELRRGRGATVCGAADHARLYALANDLLAEAARLGISRGELFALLARLS